MGAVRGWHRPAESARRLAIGGVTSRNHAVPWFTAYCLSLSDLSLSRVRTPLQKLGTVQQPIGAKEQDPRRSVCLSVLSDRRRDRGRSVSKPSPGR